MGIVEDDGDPEDRIVNTLEENVLEDISGCDILEVGVGVAVVNGS